MAKDNDNSNVYIGKKRSMNYVMSAMGTLNEGKPAKLLARGRAISRAVDVGELLINKFAKGASYGTIEIKTESLTNKDGSQSNVSAIEIEIKPGD
ncbi:MAG: RNA-binding protein [Candidatus Lokiarchaeota archaeon]|nr:RNA-binding protein [Candidatus Lokiarchaeota archaeon]MBD3201950.1 RNA-binding protein [Candidatus Lokiarchaeota archaeon]